MIRDGREDLGADRAAVRNRCHRLAGFPEMKPPRLAAHEWSAWSSRACRRSGGPLVEGRGLALHGTRYFDLDYRRAGSDYLDRQLRATGLEDHQDARNEGHIHRHVQPNGGGICAVVGLRSDAWAVAADRHQPHVLCWPHSILVMKILPASGKRAVADALDPSADGS